jgi:hypothetical protein
MSSAVVWDLFSKIQTSMAVAYGLLACSVFLAGARGPDLAARLEEFEWFMVCWLGAACHACAALLARVIIVLDSMTRPRVPDIKPERL